MGLRNIIAPRDQVQNSQGRPLAGGLVYLYEPGTTTFIQAYQDSGLTTPHTAPIRLSGSGRANIWISVDCDLRITDRNGNLVLAEENANPDSLGAGESGNLLSNGSFEDDTDADGEPDNWTQTDESGSSNARDTSESTDGAASFRFTSTGVGGGTLTTTDFFPVNDVDDLRVNFDIRSTVATVRNKVTVQWFDISQVSISNDDIYDSTANPTSFASQNLTSTPPANARFAKIQLVGIDPSVALSGSTYFDRIEAFYPATVSGIFDNIEVRNNEIITTNTNGDIHINPNGTGAVNLGNSGAVDLTDAKNAANVGAADPSSSAHLAISPAIIQAKADGTTAANLGIQTLGGDLTLGQAGGTVSVAGVLSVAQNIETTGLIDIQTAAPQLFLRETGVSVDTGNWLLEANGEDLALYLVADNLALGDTVFDVTGRTGTTLTQMTLFGGDITIDSAANYFYLGNNLDLRVDGSAYIQEQAANADVTGYGQLYVNASGQLIYRDDLGAEVNISLSAAGSANEIQFNDGAGGFDSNSNFTYNTSTGELTILDPIVSQQGLTVQTTTANRAESLVSIFQLSTTGGGSALEIDHRAATDYAIDASSSNSSLGGIRIVASGAGNALIGQTSNGTGRGGYFDTTAVGRTNEVVLIEQSSGSVSGITNALLRLTAAVQGPHITLEGSVGGDGGGIKFAATNTSTETDTLDAYEEGTWTPFIADATISDAEGQTYNAQSGFYTRIGNICYISGVLTSSSIGTLTTSDRARIGGLPFQARSGQAGGVHMHTGAGLSFTAGDHISGSISSLQQHIDLYQWANAAGTVDFTLNEWSSNGSCSFAGFYIINGA